MEVAEVVSRLIVGVGAASTAVVDQAVLAI